MEDALNLRLAEGFLQKALSIRDSLELAAVIRALYFPKIFQGKGYMKTYWLKGKKDLSFKTPAELRYSSEQKDSEDKSSNG